MISMIYLYKYLKYIPLYYLHLLFPILDFIFILDYLSTVLPYAS